MDHSFSSPYYQGYEIPDRPYRAPINQSFHSERIDLDRDRDRQQARKSDLRRTASFHGGPSGEKGQLTRGASEELNRVYSGKIPLYGQAGRPDISFMMDRVKDDIVRPKEDDSSRRGGSSHTGKGITSRQLRTALGAGGVQLAGGFFFSATHLTLVTTLVTSPTLLQHSVSANLQRVVFLAFSALSSACCAGLVPTMRYRKLATSGAILLIFSCLSASLVTDGNFLFLSYGVIAGSAYGVLRTVSLVASADVSPHFRVTSVSCASLGYSAGGILGTFVYYYFMTDYLTPGSWTNNFRILELVAVVALLCGSALRRPRGVTSSVRVRDVISDPGVHCLSVVYGLAFLAMGILLYLTPVLPPARGFENHKFRTFFGPLFFLYCGQWAAAFALALTGSVCGQAIARAGLFVAGVFVFLLGVAVIPHDVAYESFWAYMGLSLGTGVALAFAQVLVTVGMSRRVGGGALGVSVSILMLWQDLGTLLGGVCVEELNSDFTMDVALYMCGGVLLFAGIAFIVCCYTIVPLFRSPRSSRTADDDHDDGDDDDYDDGGFDRGQRGGRGGGLGGGGVVNPVMGHWDPYEADYRHMH